MLRGFVNTKRAFCSQGSPSCNSPSEARWQDAVAVFHEADEADVTGTAEVSILSHGLMTRMITGLPPWLNDQHTFSWYFKIFKDVFVSLPSTTLDSRQLAIAASSAPVVKQHSGSKLCSSSSWQGWLVDKRKAKEQRSEKNWSYCSYLFMLDICSGM